MERRDRFQVRSVKRRILQRMETDSAGFGCGRLFLVALASVARADGISSTSKEVAHPDYCPIGWVQAEFPLNHDLGCVANTIAKNPCLNPATCPPDPGKVDVYSADTDSVALGGPDTSNEKVCSAVVESVRAELNTKCDS